MKYLSILILLFFCACSSSNSTRPAAMDLTKQPPEIQLAYFDGNRNPSNSDEDVKRIRALIEYISTEMGEPAATIADDTNRGTEVLKNHGVLMSNKDFLEEAAKAVKMPDKVKKGMTFRTVVTLLVATISDGK